MFNSMEDQVYHIFMYHDTVHGLWTALIQMYAHARNESRIFDVYREISHAFQTSLELSVADYFGYLQIRWEELAQYEPLSDFPSDGAIESKRLDRRHTYQFLMGLKSEFETLRTQILNTSPLPSLYEAFAIVDGDERRRRLLPSLSLPESSLYLFPTRGPLLLLRDSPILSALSQACGGRDRGTPRTGAIAEVEPIPANSSCPTAAIVAETPTALHGKSGHPTWTLDSGANNHMTGELATFTSPVTSVHQSDPTSKKIFGKGYERNGLYYFGDPLPSNVSSSSHHVFSPPVLESSVLSPSDVVFLETVLFFYDSTPSPGPGSEKLAANDPIPPRPLPILESPSSMPIPNGSLSPIASQDPSPRAQAPLPVSSPESGMSPPFVSDIPLPRYPTRVGQLREVSNKANNAELKLYLEVELGQDLRPIPPPVKTKENILLFFKLYDPLKEEHRYVGRLYVKANGKPVEILTKLNELAGFAPDVETELFEEIKFEPSVMCEHIDKKVTFRGSQVVRFRSLEKPKEDEFCLELSKLHTYDDAVERVASHLGLDDPAKIRLISHNCYSQQPKPQPIKYRGVEHLSDMLVHYNQTSDILYHEVLDIPLPELQGLKTLKVAFHHATKDEVIILTIRLPKQNTVEDVINDLRTKVELSHPNAELRLLEVFYHKIYKIFPLNEKIENINDQYWTLRAEEELPAFLQIPLGFIWFVGMELGRNGIMAGISLEWKWGRNNHSHSDVWLCIGIGYSTRSRYDIWWWIVSGRDSRGEKNLGPRDRLIHVYHFMKDTSQNQVVQNFGEPFFLVIHEGETLTAVKERIQKKLQVLDEEFLKWRFAFLSLGRPEYLQDTDIVSSRFQRKDVYGAWEQYLGLEHSDNAPKEVICSKSGM
ncbi:ubiquitin-specific protease 12 [Actinidia rufa]|uniref:ubiquitinyl hydrolase 1 n=1 Tax=Actinidia rufa TaxID=165716 RepID=A0A7J0DZH1_9ERIC|nr:ubiquitin-specific protease 12 [Actinidia rufa]